MKSTDAIPGIAVRAIIEVGIVLVVALIVNSIWNAAASPYQATVAAGQLEDSNAAYAASRAAATFNPTTLVFGIASVAILFVILKAARKTWLVTKES